VRCDVKYAVVDSQTRALLVLAESVPPLPEGVACEVVELADAEAAKVGGAATYRVVGGAVVATPVEVPPDPPSLEEQVANLSAALDAILLGGA
jgi:hypothetical protein